MYLKISQTTANGRTKHGFPYKQEYIDTIVFENDKISTFIEYIDTTLLNEILTKEKIAAEAELDC